MLETKSPKESKTEEDKYAENAIEILLDALISLGSNKASIEICLVGGANALRKKNDTTADNHVFNIFKMIALKKLSIEKTSLGRHERRTAILCLYQGRVTFTLRDKSEAELFNFISGNAEALNDA